MDVDELHNGDTDATQDPRFARDAAISYAPTFTIGFTTITSIRNGIGQATAKKEPEPAEPEPAKPE